MESLGGQRWEARKEEFMGGRTVGQMKAMREAFSVELRKQNRREKTQKRRMLLNAAYVEGEEMQETPMRIDQIPAELLAVCPFLANPETDEETKVKAFKHLLDTTTAPELALMTLTVLRKSLSQTVTPSVQLLIRYGYVPLLVGYLDPEVHQVATVCEAAWILCNIFSASNNGPEEAVNLGVVRRLLALVRGDMLGAAENALFALGNIAGECEAYKALLISEGLLPILYQLVMESPELHCELSRTAAWVCRQLLSSQFLNHTTLDTIYRILVTLYDMDDLNTKLEVAHALSTITNWSYPLSEVVAHTGVLPILLMEPENRSDCLIQPTVMALGHLAEADEDTTQMVLDAGLLDALSVWVRHDSADIRKDVLWTLSNITAGSMHQLAQFFAHPICAQAVKYLDDPVCSVRKEASFVYCHFVKFATVAQRLTLLDFSIFSYLKPLFSDSAQNTLNAIKIAEKILSAGEIRATDSNADVNAAAVLFEASGCLDGVTALATRNIPNLSHEAEALINAYFSKTEESEAYDAPTSGPYRLS